MAEKTAAKPARKSVPGKMAKGQAFECSVCGLEVIVDEECGCAAAHEIICCEKPMARKTSRASASKK